MGATIGMPRRDVHHTFEAIFLGKVTLMTDALDRLEETLKGRHQINHTEDEVLIYAALLSLDGNDSFVELLIAGYLHLYLDEMVTEAKAILATQDLATMKTIRHDWEQSSFFLPPPTQNPKVNSHS
jgi:hypothetical protein